MQKKYLFLVRGFYPKASPSGNLILPLAKKISEKNYVKVVSLGEKKEEIKLNNNLVCETIVSEPISVYKNRINRLLVRIKKNYYDKSIFKTFSEYLNSNEVEKFDVVIAVTYEEMLALAHNQLIKTEKKRIFMLEKFFYNNELWINKQKEIEKNLLENIKTVYALPIAAKYLKKRFPLREYIVLDHPMVTNNTSDKCIKNPVPIILYGGGIDRKQRNPIEILNLFNEVNKITDLKIKFFTYGNMQIDLKEYSSENLFFESNTSISLDAYRKELVNSDFLLSIGNKESDIVPSKLFDYVSTGKPIIHFSYHDDDPYYRYLKKYTPSLIINMNNFTLNKNFEVKKIVNFIEINKDGYNNMKFEDILEALPECTPEYVANQIFCEESEKSE